MNNNQIRVAKTEMRTGTPNKKIVQENIIFSVI